VDVAYGLLFSRSVFYIVFLLSVHIPLSLLVDISLVVPL